MSGAHAAADLRPLTRAGATLGIGLMALLDGFVFFDILRWHDFAGALVEDEGMRRLVNGAYYVAAWAATVVGVVLLWRTSRTMRLPGGDRALWGSALLGAAGVNLFDLLVDHLLLGLHRMHPSGNPLWDLGFAAFSLGLAALGYRSLRSSSVYRLARAERRLERGLRH